MADYFQTVIDTRAGLAEADHLARHVVLLLSGRGIVAGKPSQEGGYDRGPNANDISASEPGASWAGHEAIPPVYSHLQVLIGRLTHSDDLSEFRTPRALCPSCGRTLEDLDGNWHSATQAWISGDDDAGLLCAACGKESPVAAWGYESRFGFGNLAFRFWNWPPLSPAFLEEMRRELQHPIVLVKGKL
ncbi:MAG TPA: hypothetical protein VMU54_18145 [Planctomycetota bacterium]|nr:hypothetical protein [Planctomycetota bacterium]